MNKISAEHLSRAAYVYVRQSTPGQLTNNPESRRRQYALKDRAHSLGWENVIVVDDDLGHTACGTERLGFEQLLTAVCTSAAGAVLAIEDSRLARNLREWHTLLEFCGLVNCLLIDETNIYDPRQINDRLLLGMKGTFSELELSLLRQRSQEALRLKAARGELHKNVPIGYVRSANNTLEMDPDQRVREAIQLAFRKFEELGSIRQVGIWLADARIQMPFVVYRDQSRMVAWRLPQYSMLHRLLTNPIYAGAHAYGRTGFKVRIKNGRKAIARGIRRPREAWNTLIPNHHQGYISWEDYERNQRIIKGNANMKGVMVPGSPRDGIGVLAGLLRCGHCGRKLMVHHGGVYRVATYVCNSAGSHGRRKKCIRVGNLRVDAAVSEEVLRVIAPLGLDAALQVLADRERTGTERLNQLELALKQARYEASRVERQYNAVDPENRLVAGNLERSWNERLVEVARLEGEIRTERESQPPATTEAERAEILALGTDLPRLWNHPNASTATRKRILRTVLEEIVVTVDSDRVRLKLHWKGGDHTELEVLRGRAGQHRWKTNLENEQLIRDLARLAPDDGIASILNRLGVRTAKGHTWTQKRIAAFRSDHNIAVYRDGERAERGEVNVREAAEFLGVSKMTVIRLIKDGLLPAKQACMGVPYVIRDGDLDLPAVRSAIKKGRSVSQDTRQQTFDYQ